MLKRRITKLGPCVSRMRHRFPKKNDEKPAGYEWKEMPDQYVIKRCLNCAGQFWFHDAFTDIVRNTTPSVELIGNIREQILAAEKN